MRLVMLMFAAGSAILCLLPRLPAPDWLWLAVPPALVGLIPARSRWLAAMVLGAAWAGTYCRGHLATELPAASEGKLLLVSGIVTGLPRQGARFTQFQLVLDDCRQCWSRTRIRLTWYRREPGLRPGQRWQFRVRLKRPHGFANPGLFDYESWLIDRGISATGYVLSAHRLSDSGRRRPIDQLRYWLRREVLDNLPPGHLARLLVALSVGESGQVSRQDWQTLSDTGTNHLMVISGLHVGLVAGMSYRLAVWIFGGWLAASRRWAAGTGLLVAAFYGVIAGMGLPVQRALVMTAVGLSGLLLGRRVSPVDMYIKALFLVTLLDPLAILNTGFWLSFGAVFVLLYVFTGRVTYAGTTPKARLGAAARTQLAVFAGMCPMLLFFVFQVSLVACLVNLVAIPWVGLLVIPWLLVAIPLLAAWHWAGVLFLKLAWFSLGGLWQILAYAASYRWIYYGPHLGVPVLVLGLAGSAVLLAPRGLLPRWLGLLMLLPAFARPPPLLPGEVRLAVLDTGEDLVAIVRSRGYRLVFETRPAGPRRFDTTGQVLVPLLRQQGNPRRLDALVTDAGADAIPASLVHSFLVQSLVAGTACGQVGELHRSIVRYTLLPAGADRACVLLVQSGDFRILLPGDLAPMGEQALVRNRLAPVTVLIAPRNGRAGSSGPAFLNLLSPKIAIFATGYRNRRGHPAAMVTQRYSNRHVSTYNTASDGAVLVDYRPGEGVTVVTTRQRRKRFWYD